MKDQGSPTLCPGLKFNAICLIFRFIIQFIYSTTSLTKAMHITSPFQPGSSPYHPMRWHDVLVKTVRGGYGFEMGGIQVTFNACTILGKLLTHSVSQFPHLKMGIITILTLLNCFENCVKGVLRISKLRYTSRL